VTDRRSLGGASELSLKRLLGKLEDVSKAEVDWIQLREKDLSGREMAKLTESAIHRAGNSCAVLLNDRVDVACAVGAHGVHLGEQSLPPEEAIRLAVRCGRKENFMVGVSAHSIERAMLAEKAGADYVIFGPVYATPSKATFGQPQGVQRLREVCQQLQIPVLAIGGVTLKNAGECIAAGARGVAAIRLFQEAEDLEALVNVLRRLW
jgi:thiamine-phosphate pyrophosphorylase